MLDANSARFAYAVSGAGHPFTLLHAGIADSRMWDDQVPTFAQHYRVIRYDARGFGRTEFPAVPYSTSEDVCAIIDALGVEKTYLLGCSMGGGVALDFALSQPDRVDALILVGAGISGRKPSPELTAAFQRVEDAFERGGVAQAVELESRMWVDGPKRSPDQVNPDVRRRVDEMNTLAYSHAAQMAQAQHQPLDPPAIGRLSEVHAPTLVVVGDGDQSDVIEAAELLAQGIPGARLTVMAGLGHVPNMEQPNDFNRLVLDFLSQLG
ncbi:MAG: alpha/beta fold hydrolase [Ktedonobacterales bacterium]